MNKPSFLIISDDIENHALYEGILHIEGFDRVSCSTLDELTISDFKHDIYLVDIM